MSLQPASAISVDPPAPDIQCTTHAGEILTFELGEIVDPELVRNTALVVKLSSIFEATVADAPERIRQELTAKYKSSNIHVWFRDASLRRSSQAIFELLDYLAKVPQLSGAHTPTGGISRSVRKVHIWSTKLDGPRFSVDGALGVRNPVLDTLTSKFFKSHYEAPHPIELLLYYDIQLASPEAIWLPGVKNFIDANLSRSFFRRVWVYSIQDERILFDSRKMENGADF